MRADPKVAREILSLTDQAQFACFVLVATVGLSSPLVFLWTLGIVVQESAMGMRPSLDAIAALLVSALGCGLAVGLLFCQA